MDHSGSGNSLGYITEPSREVLVVHEPDVLVIGAGPAGIGTAVGPRISRGGRLGRSTSSCKKYVGGFKDSYIVDTGVQVGVGETRPIVGDYSQGARMVPSRRQATTTLS